MRENNFDAVRVFAAAQVAVFHCANHLKLMAFAGPETLFFRALPGVPVFFVVSGFLISMSYERNSDVRQYAWNRVLRIYPALWVCLILSIACAALIGGVSFFHPKAALWLVAQLTLGQFYNPDFLRSYGTGALNGSLWTIPVELQFYAVLPVMYRALGLTARKRPLTLAFVGCGSLLVWFASGLSSSGAASAWGKLAGVTVVPYLWMFLLGVAMQRHFAVIERFVVGKAGYWLVGYGLFVLLGDALGFSMGTNLPNPVAMVMIAFTVIACAYTSTGLSRRLLRGNDISYGVYIYHGVALNAAVALGVPRSVSSLGGVMIATFALAVASWLLIEKPSMRKKANPLHPVTAARAG